MTASPSSGLELVVLLFLLIVALSTQVNAQYKSWNDVPSCGQTCIQAVFGAAARNPQLCDITDTSCLCRTDTYETDITDCCRNINQAVTNTIIEYASGGNFCANPPPQALVQVSSLWISSASITPNGMSTTLTETITSKVSTVSVIATPAATSSRMSFSAYSSSSETIEISAISQAAPITSSSTSSGLTPTTASSESPNPSGTSATPSGTIDAAGTPTPHYPGSSVTPQPSSRTAWITAVSVLSGLLISLLAICGVRNLVRRRRARRGPIDAEGIGRHIDNEKTLVGSEDDSTRVDSRHVADASTETTPALWKEFQAAEVSGGNLLHPSSTGHHELA